MFSFVGWMFVAQGGPFAISSPCWGYLCDKFINANAIVIMGAFFNLLAFLFIGPVIPIPTLLSVCIVSLITQGIGVSAQLVAGFSVAQKAGK